MNAGERPGSQLERTAMAWDRTALGLIGTAGLLMLREARPLLAGAALLIALACVVLGRDRGRRLGGPEPVAAVPVALLATLVVALELAVLATIVLG